MNRQEKRKARIYALKMAYAYEMTLNKDSLNKKINLDNDAVDNLDDIIDYSTRLVNSYIKSIEKLDSLIISKSSNWDISRIALIDRIIIRLALCEILYFDEIPGKVSIVEAVEISKEYSTIDSSSFINGILDSIYNDKKIKQII